jgi:diaminopimelate decarboxylase
MEVAAIVERHFPPAGGRLTIGGIPISDLADRYGTPVFVYDRAIIAKNWDALRSALPAEFSIYYSVKANPTQAILKCLLAKGAGLEIASGGEFHQALNAGCPAANIIFAGPGKSEAELETVLAHGIREIHVESLTEAGRIASIAGRLGVPAPIALRVNPVSDAEGGAMRMGGRAAPFGVDEEIVDETVDRILSLSTLALRGIHLFAGTQILSSEILITQYRKGLAIARRVADRLNRPLSTLDFGGGLGIPYFAHEHELDIQAVQTGVHALMEEVRHDPLFDGTHFYVEPGRYLVGEAGVYITRISDIKISRGKKFLIVDGGMNHHLAASGNLGQTIKRNFPLAVVNKLDRAAEEVVDVVGPLCTPLDILARGVNLPRTEIGDLIGVFQSGAYARSASPLGFLSHGTPPEVLADGGSHSLLRRRGNVEDYLRDQCFTADSSWTD